MGVPSNFRKISRVCGDVGVYISHSSSYSLFNIESVNIK